MLSELLRAGSTDAEDLQPAPPEEPPPPEPWAPPAQDWKVDGHVGVISAPPIIFQLPLAAAVASATKLAGKKRKKGGATNITIQNASASNPKMEVECSARRKMLEETLFEDGGTGFLTDEAKRRSPLRQLGELLRLGELEALCDVCAACAEWGSRSLDAFKEVISLVKATGKDRTLTYEVYKRVIDMVCLSTDEEFPQEALECLISAGFAPKVGEFVNRDAQDYFVRQQYFLSLELTEEIGQQLERLRQNNHVVPCEIYPSTLLLDRPGGPRPTDMNMWDIKPLRAWQQKRDRWADGHAVHQVPVRGDVVILMIGQDIIISLVQEGARHHEHMSSPTITVAVEQGDRMRRLLDDSRESRCSAVVGGSKIAYDRMRSAVFDLSRKSSTVPALQQWLLLRQPTPANAMDKDIPKDGKCRLYVRLRENNILGDRWSIIGVGAEWTPHLVPGMRRGTMVFVADNPYGAKDYDPEAVHGMVVIASRGDCGFADKVRNAAEAGAVGMIIVDTGESKELFEMQRDDKPFVVDFNMGDTPGIRLSLRADGRAIVEEVNKSSPAFGKVSKGDLVDGTVGEGELSYEECEDLLGKVEPIATKLQVVFRWHKSMPLIPAILIRREEGERLVLASQDGAKKSQAPVAEIHVSLNAAEMSGLPELLQVQLNGPQLEAMRGVLGPQGRGGKGGGRVTLIQGPPGTGKTTTALHVIKAWLDEDNEWEVRVDPASGKPYEINVRTQEKRMGDPKAMQNSRKILITGFSNIAIDNLALGLSKYNMPGYLRVGRGQTLLKHGTIEEQMQHHRQFSELEGLRGPDHRGSNRGEALKLERRIMQDLIQSARIILSTCITAGGDVLQGARFRRVLFDESTQATEPAALTPLVKGCEELVLLGDQKQLPPTVMCNKARQFGLHESLFERLVRLGLPHTMLQVQYRMHPALSAFPSKTFYGSLLSNGVGAEARPAPQGYKWPNPTLPLCFEGLGGQKGSLEESKGTSKCNKTEAKRVADIAWAIVQAGDVEAEEIAVITPYAAQADILKMMLGRGPNPIQVATVDSYQGMERDVVIVSTVRSSSWGGIGFLSDRRRFNVLLTRARRGLIVVGNQQTLLGDPCWKCWIDHVAHQQLMCGTVDWSLHEEPEEALALEDEFEKHNYAESGPGQWLAFAGQARADHAEIDKVVAAAIGPRLPGMPTPAAPGSIPFSQMPAPSVLPTVPAPSKSDAELKKALAQVKAVLLTNEYTGFELLGKVPVDFQHEGNCITGMVVLVLPGQGTKVAQGSGRNKLEAEAMCCGKALEILIEAGMDDQEGSTPALEAVAKALEEVNAGVEMSDVAGGPIGAPDVPMKVGLVRGNPVGFGGGGGGPVGMHPKQALMSTGLFGGGSNWPMQMSETGPPHNRTFTATLQLPEQVYTMNPEMPPCVTSEAKNKKEAEKQCCEHALAMLQEGCPQIFMMKPLAQGGGKSKKKQRCF